MAGLSHAWMWGLRLLNPLSLRDIPLFRGNAGTCCATLAEPGWLPVVASLLPPATAADAAFVAPLL